MRLVQIISGSRDGNRKEIIARDSDGRRTLHIHRKRNEWKYFVGHDRQDKKVFLPISIGEKNK